jgi:regulator-associated protein of mTOR
MTPKRALETIAAELQRQYERWQAKARYKPSLDPTQEDIKKLCMTLRRNARVCICIKNSELLLS